MQNNTRANLEARFGKKFADEQEGKLKQDLSMLNAPRERLRTTLRAMLDAKFGKEVIDARDRVLKQEFMDNILNKGNHIKYVKELTRKEAEDEYPINVSLLDSKLHGREVVVEYHLFTIMDTIPMIQQRRW